MAHRYDVCIMGGGLAGLTLARQLRHRTPSLDIAVIEHRRFPVREAAHKVGESTVEIAAHYLANELGLSDHLRDGQLRKFGLRLFFRGDRPVIGDLGGYDEVGPSSPLPITTYQIDRGRLENHLAVCWQGMGQLRDGTTIRSVSLSPGAHRLLVRDAQEGKENVLHCRYLVDASGRRGLLRNQNLSARPARHSHHAVWFRVEGRLDIDGWSSDAVWSSRCGGLSRRASTNHFTGPGYWLWLIPLASDVTSVGLVFDPNAVALREVRKRADLLKWLALEPPIVAEHVAAHDPIDHHVVENYAIANNLVYSSQDWAATGDAGVFSDPFYSPGGDFVALSNGYVSELITNRAPAERARQYQQHYQSFFRNALSLYRGQYVGFGDRDFMVLKLLWDYAFYWSIVAKLYYSGKFVDVDFMRANEGPLRHAAVLHVRMQRLFRQRALLGRRVGGEGLFFDHHCVRLFHELQRDLLNGCAEHTDNRLRQNVMRLETIQTTVAGLLERSLTGTALPELSQIGGLAEN